MGYIKAGSIQPATSTALGGVKIGSGIIVTEDGTISSSVPSGGTSSSVTDVYLISGSIRGMGREKGPAPTNQSALRILAGVNTVLEVSLSSGAVKRFPFPTGITYVNAGDSLRMNLTSGELRTSSASDTFTNEVLLARVALDAGSIANQGKNVTLVVGGYLMKYFYPNGIESEQILEPKNIATKTVPSGGGYQSMNFIGEELWIFDKYSNTSSIKILDPLTYEIKKSMPQNGFHFNTTDYNAEIDTLLTIAGWGDNPSDPLGTSIMLLPGVSTWKNKTGTVVDMGDLVANDIVYLFGFGHGPQAVWGERNGGQNNVIYVLSDSGARIKKLVLGKGDKNYGLGVFTEGKANTRYNGSFKVLGEWTQVNGSGNIQDGFFYNGSFYAAHDSGSDTFDLQGAMITKMDLMSDGRIRKTRYLISSYDADGNQQNAFSAGCTVKDGKAYILIGNEMINFNLQ